MHGGQYFRARLKWHLLWLFGAAGLCLGSGPALAQLTGSEPQERTFHGSTDTCIFNDSRGGARNCITGTATFLNTPAAVRHGSVLQEQRLRSEEVTFLGAGLDLGGDHGGWTLQQGEFRLVTSYARGITQNLELLSRCRRIGDCANYFYIEHDGGVAANGDEAVEALGLQANETSHPYVGSVAGTSGIGDERPKISGDRSQWVTDGGMLVDITRGALAGELTGTSSVMDGYAVQLRLTGKVLPRSSAWGTVAAGYDKAQTLANVSVPVTVDVTLGAVGGKRGVFAPGAVCVAGPGHFEQAVVVAQAAGEALPTAAPGHQWVKMLVRYPNPNVTAEGKVRSPMLFQGGVCGQYVSSDEDLRFSGMRTTYPAFGSLEGDDLITGKEVGGGMSPYLPQEGAQAWAAKGPGSRFHLYPGAEIVANTGLAPELEPNRVAWTVGDRIESPHYMTVAQNVLFLVDQQASPTDRSFGGSGISLFMTGKGMAGTHKGIVVTNGEAKSSYRPYGGPLSPPNATYFEGQFGNVEQVINAPNRALIGVTFCNEAKRFALFDLPDTVTDHAVKVDYDCASGAVRVPRLLAEQANVSGSLQRGGSEVCTEDGAHCPGGSGLKGTVAVQALAAGSCSAFTGEVAGLRETMTITASARGNPGLVTTTTYFAGAGLAGLVVCSPVGASRAVVYNVSAR